ncbi:MAG: hypothetical protein ACK456_00795 [Pseudanabaenaceae cyanobacterium]|jgi:hypothetical protein
MVDTKAVSVRLPLDLVEQLSTYAHESDLVRAGEPNIGGAIIAILKQYFGGTDKPADDPLVRRDLVDALIKNAVDQLQSEFNSKLFDLEHKISKISTDATLLSSTQTLGNVNQTEIQILKQKLESLEKNMAETAKKPPYLIKEAA